MLDIVHVGYSAFLVQWRGRLAARPSVLCCVLCSDVCLCCVDWQAAMMQMVNTHQVCCHWHIRDWHRVEAWLPLHRWVICYQSHHSHCLASQLKMLLGFLTC